MSLAVPGGRILPYEMDEPAAALLRLSRFLGAGPPRDASRKRSWFLLIGGLAVVVWFGLLWKYPDGSRPFLAPTEIVLGLMVAAQGAAGLLGEDRWGLSLWLLAFNGLFFVPFVLLAGAFLYAWMGVLGAGAWAVFLVLVGIWMEARRRRRAL
jgi:hypothetical protein